MHLKSWAARALFAALGAVLLGACDGRSVVGAPSDAGGMDARIDVGSCTDGLSLCGASCVDTRANASHCGACGNACSPGNVCVNGACMQSCPASQTLCGGLCVSTRTDREHCGACGNVCAAGQVCSNGACALNCATNLQTCSRGDADGGAGGATAAPAGCLPLGEVCSGGDVPGVVPLGADQLLGHLPRRIERPRQLRRLRQRLPAGQVCSAGTCTVSCGAGLTTATASAATRRRTSPTAAHAAAPARGAGVLRRAPAPCRAERDHQLLGRLPRPHDRPANCGACGRACAAGQVCSAGACTVSCGRGPGRLRGRLP
jgi:hypothetical protein